LGFRSDFSFSSAKKSLNVPSFEASFFGPVFAYANLLPKPLTTVRLPCKEIGIVAIAVMLERVANSNMPVRDFLLGSSVLSPKYEVFCCDQNGLPARRSEPDWR
jgi:hypothetical protein